MDMKIEILPHGPLEVVLVQIRYTPIVQIGAYVAHIQELLRKSGFPQYLTLQLESVQPGLAGEPQNTKRTQWVFSSVDWKQNLIMDSEQLTLQLFDCKGINYNNFIEAFLTVIAKMDEIVGFSAFTRLGLRYINAIPETNGQELSWKRLISKSFQGGELPNHIQWGSDSLTSVVMQQSVLLSESKKWSNVVVKVFQSPHGNKYPAEIMKFPPQEPDTFPDKPKVTYVDLDHFLLFGGKDITKISLDIVRSLFKELHGLIEDLFFNTIITEHARRIWK